LSEESNSISSAVGFVGLYLKQESSSQLLFSRMKGHNRVIKILMGCIMFMSMGLLAVVWLDWLQSPSGFWFVIYLILMIPLSLLILILFAFMLEFLTMLTVIFSKEQQMLSIHRERFGRTKITNIPFIDISALILRRTEEKMVKEPLHITYDLELRLEDGKAISLVATTIPKEFAELERWYYRIGSLLPGYVEKLDLRQEEESASAE
jgi:hypothetical protein